MDGLQRHSAIGGGRLSGSRRCALGRGEGERAKTLAVFVLVHGKSGF